MRRIPRAPLQQDTTKPFWQNSEEVAERLSTEGQMGSDEPTDAAGGEDADGGEGADAAADEPGEESTAPEPEPEAEETGGDAPSSDTDESAAAAEAAPARKLSAPMGGSPWTANEWPPAHCPGGAVQIDPRSTPD